LNINIFEGARRIALLVGAIWSAGWLAYGVFSDPDPAMRLAVRGPGRVPVQVAACGAADASRYVHARLPDSGSVRAELCFTAHKADDGRMLVPYQIKTVHIELPGKVVKEVPASLTRRQLLAQLEADGYDTSTLKVMRSKPQDEPFAEFRTGGTWQMGETHSSEVRSYIDGVVENLVLSPEAAKEATGLQWRARMLRLWEAAQFLFGGLICGWILVASVGWVVRGFMGIPRGTDRRAAS
jgi:hypothetical protein